MNHALKLPGFSEMFAIPKKRGRPAAPAYLKEEQRLDRNALAKARRLVAKYDIWIDKDSTGYWIGSSLDDSDQDPLEGNHFCSSGREVLEAVEVLINHATGDTK